MNELADGAEELRQLRVEIARLGLLQAETFRRLASVQAESQAFGTISAMIANGVKLEPAEFEKELRDQFTERHRESMQRANDFLLARGFLTELPGDDPRWDEPDTPNTDRRTFPL